MEYIEGRALGEWMAAEQPDLARRLKVFAAIAAAVHHAHQHLVIHRDIKPGNILMRGDDDPVLLDFGIGKLLDDSGDCRATTALQALTPAYASPEQLAGRPASIASDVFALGLLLYELLTGEPLRKDVERIGSYPVTTRPSLVARRTAPPWLRQSSARIRGDLDWITLKALRLEPERRYASAAALAEDIERFGQGRIVTAAPERLSYVLGHWLRRHPVAGVASLLIVLMVAAFSWQLKNQRDRAMLAERKALAEAEAANEVTQFLLGLFNGADPQFARGREVSAREMLERGSRELEQKLLDRPLLRARLLAAVGTVYTSIGLPKPSIASLAEAVRLLDADPRADPLILANALNELGRAHSKLQDFAHALPVTERALALRERLLPPGHPDIGHSLSAMGVALQGQRRFDEAEVAFRRGLKIFEEAGPGEEGASASLLHNLALVERERLRYDAARDYYLRALAIKQRVYGERHPLTLNTLQGLATNAGNDGKLDEAERWMRQSHALRVEVHGERSIEVASSYNEMASIEQDRGRLRDAEAHYRAALAVHEQLGSAESMNAAGTLNNLATLLEDRGDPAGAEALQRRSLAIRIAINGVEHETVFRARHNLARQLYTQGRLDEAAAAFEEALAGRRKTMGPEHPETLDSVLYTVLIDHVRHPQLPVDGVRAALDALRVARKVHDAPVLRGQRQLIELLPPAERGVELAELQRAAAAVLDPAHPMLAELRLRSAEHWLEAGDPVRARRELGNAATPLRAELVPTATALQRLARLERSLADAAH